MKLKRKAKSLSQKSLELIDRVWIIAYHPFSQLVRARFF